jgi:hypothetical protein
MMTVKEIHITSDEPKIKLGDGSGIIDAVNKDGRPKGDSVIPVGGKNRKVDWQPRGTHGTDIHVGPVVTDETASKN